MGNEFNLRVAGIAIQRGFEKGFQQGIRQVGNQIDNIFARTQEIIDPVGKYFRTPFEERRNERTGKQELYWPKYEQSISRSLLSNAALLRLNGAPKEEIDQAKAVWKMWVDVLEPKILALPKDEGVQFLALRGSRAEDGVSMQQVSRQGGQLILESQLLPFNQADQIDNFRNLFGEKGKEVNLESAEGNVDPAVTWAVQGPAVNFQQDLPGLINDAYRWQLARPDFLPSVTIPMGVRQESQFIAPALSSIKPEFKEEKLASDIKIKSVDSFWFEAAAAPPSITETATPVSVANETISGSDPEVPTRLDLEGIEEKPVIIFAVSTAKPEEKFKPLIATKQHLNDTVVNDRRCFPEKLAGVEKIYTFDYDRGEKCESLMTAVEESCTFFGGEKPVGNKIERVIKQESEKQRKAIYEVPKRRGKVLVEKLIQPKIEIPIYQPRWQPMAIEDIPEWVWQGTTTGLDEIIDWQWFLVTMFYALLNTKVLLEEKNS